MLERMVWFLITSVVLLLGNERVAEAFVPSERFGRMNGSSLVQWVVPRLRVLDLTSSYLGSSKRDDASEETSKVVSRDNEQKEPVLKALLSKEYSTFAKLLSLNPGLWELLEKESAATIFAPTNEAFEKLGEKRLRQLRDIRNEETAQKIGQYHVVLGDAVSAARLRTEDWTVKLPTSGQPRPIKVSGLVTMGGEVPVGRIKPKSLPLFQQMLGAVTQATDAAMNNSSTNKNTDICIGPAGRIQKSYKLDNGKYYVHEVDGFISPDILWRYCDQLRIPGF